MLIIIYNLCLLYSFKIFRMHEIALYICLKPLLILWFNLRTASNSKVSKILLIDFFKVCFLFRIIWIIKKIVLIMSIESKKIN